MAGENPTRSELIQLGIVPVVLGPNGRPILGPDDKPITIGDGGRPVTSYGTPVLTFPDGVPMLGPNDKPVFVGPIGLPVTSDGRPVLIGRNGQPLLDDNGRVMIAMSCTNPYVKALDGKESRLTNEEMINIIYFISWQIYIPYKKYCFHPTFI